MSQKRNQFGFTVLELLMVLIICVILTALALPSFIQSYQEYTTTDTAQDLLYNLQYARSEAIKRDQNIYISFSTADPWCYGINNGSACNCTTAGSCSLGTFNESHPLEFTLTTSGLSNNSLILEGTRGATTNGATIITFTVYGGSTAMSVEVTAIGDMQLCSSTISGYPACT